MARTSLDEALHVRERIRQPQLLKDSFREMMKGVCTSIPGHILAFNPDTQLAQVQIGVQRVDLNGSSFPVQPIIETPVYMPGGNWCLEYQIESGTEGCILFSQRCIDGWINEGGTAVNPIGRFHDMQDALFLPGFRSMPNALPDFQNNGVRLRNKAGDQFAWLKNDGSIAVENRAGHIRIGADGTVTINGVTISPTGLISNAEDVLTKTDISLNNHLTSGVQSGTQTSGVPVVS